MTKVEIDRAQSAAAHDLLILQRAEALPMNAIDMLKRKGYSLRITKNRDEVAALLEKLAAPIFIINCGAKVGSIEYASWFYNQAQVTEFPVLVLGRDVEGLEDQLKEYFPVATTLRNPCTPNDLLDAVRYISENYERGKPKVEKPESAATEETPATPAAPEPAKPQVPLIELDELPVEASHKLYGEAESIPNLVFKQLQEFNLFSADLGGSEYPTMLRFTHEDQMLILPKNDAVVQSFLELGSELGRWGTAHLCRVALITKRLLQPFTFERELKLDGQLSAMLFPFAFSARNRALLKRDYLGRGTLTLRKELCSLVKDSSLQISHKLGLQQVTEIVALLGRLIGRDQPLSDEPQAIVASAIMAADHTDRVCYRSGIWDPRPAYTLSRHIKEGKFRDFHPAVLCCLIKFLSEALTSSNTAFLLSSQVRENPDLLKKAQDNREQEVSPTEAKIPITALAPGMRLSRPLFAFDGREILTDDLVLDEDLIWRIWQLSALRPLNSPVVVKNRKS